MQNEPKTNEHLSIYKSFTNDRAKLILNVLQLPDTWAMSSSWVTFFSFTVSMFHFYPDDRIEVMNDIHFLVLKKAHHGLLTDYLSDMILIFESLYVHWSYWLSFFGIIF